MRKLLHRVADRLKKAVPGSIVPPNESLRLAEDFPEARFALGMVYLHQENFDAAIEILSRGLVNGGGANGGGT